MPKRSEHWEKGLSDSLLKSREERTEYYLSLLEEGFTWRESLKIIVDTIGVKEYAELSEIKPPNLISQLSEKKDIRLSTLEKMIRPLNVSISFHDFKKSA